MAFSPKKSINLLFGKIYSQVLKREKTTKNSMPKKRIIGRWDRVDLPDLGLESVEAKIDTGAYTSSLHVSSLRRFSKDNTSYVEFRLIHPKASVFKDELITLPLHSKRRIKSSTGISRQRMIVKTPVVIFGEIINAEFSLTDRSRMGFPILIGRKLLLERFIVDVSKQNVSYKEKRKG